MTKSWKAYYYSPSKILTLVCFVIESLLLLLLLLLLPLLSSSFFSLEVKKMLYHHHWFFFFLDSLSSLKKISQPNTTKIYLICFSFTARCCPSIPYAIPFQWDATAGLHSNSTSNTHTIWERQKKSEQTFHWDKAKAWCFLVSAQTAVFFSLSLLLVWWWWWSILSFCWRDRREAKTTTHNYVYKYSVLSVCIPKDISKKQKRISASSFPISVQQQHSISTSILFACLKKRFDFLFSPFFSPLLFLKVHDTCECQVFSPDASLVCCCLCLFSSPPPTHFFKQNNTSSSLSPFPFQLIPFHSKIFCANIFSTEYNTEIELVKKNIQ